MTKTALMALFREAGLPAGPFRWEQIYEMPDGSVHWAICDPVHDAERRITDTCLILHTTLPTYSDDEPSTWGTPLSQHPTLRLVAALLTWIAQEAALTSERAGGGA